MPTSGSSKDGNSGFSIIGGERDVPSTLGGKNVYLVTPPNTLSTAHQPNSNLPSNPEGISFRHNANQPNNIGSQVVRPAAYKVEDVSGLKNSGKCSSLALINGDINIYWFCETADT